MELIVFAIKNDWGVLLPIMVCSILVLAVAVERIVFYRRNRRDVVQFINRLERDLLRNNLDYALALSGELGGLLGEVSEEAIRILAEQKSAFERLYDITANLAVRKLERNLAILGTIATVSPYLGLFGTVVRILLTFGEMSRSGGAGGTPTIMFGIGSALIATARGNSSTASGRPIIQPAGNSRGNGASAGSPRGLSPASQARRSALSAGASERSFFQCEVSPGAGGAANHGGMAPRVICFRIIPACARISS